MSAKYDKSYQISREQEGSYHRREVEPLPHSKTTSGDPKNYTTTSYQVVKAPCKTSKSPSSAMRHRSQNDASDDDNDNFEEWTTTKRKVNHKTRQVETRVSRQLLLEDGKLIADSGPQVITRIKEDNKEEECEKEKAPKNKSKFDALESAPEVEAGSGRVLGEKKEIKRVSHEVREEHMQYHDERYKELTGSDMHQRAIRAPHELMDINDKDQMEKPRGKMVHYEQRGKKYQDTDEILEVAKLAIDGSITKEVTRKKHHEEFSEDELPDEKGEAEALRREPVAEKSSRKHVDYVNDFDEQVSPSDSDDNERLGSRSRQSRARDSRGHQRTSGHAHQQEERAFPRYQIDPLLNSLRDEDFKTSAPSSNYQQQATGSSRSSSGRQREHRLVRHDSPDSGDRQQHHAGPRSHHGARHQRPTETRPLSRGEQPEVVQVPEEYRVNKQRLLERQGKSSGGSHLSPHRSSLHRSAAVQARLTDEEEDERKSLRSASSSDLARGNNLRGSRRQETRHTDHPLTTGHRNKQPAAQGHGRQRQRSPSSVSSSSSSLSDPKERLRAQGARSRDSGFRSPAGGHSSAGSPQHIYSVSSKSQRRNGTGNEFGGRDVVSPAPTARSEGQRSVKTTTTTLSAGLADERQPTRPNRKQQQPAAGGGSRRPEQHSGRQRGAKPFEWIISSSDKANNRQQQPPEAISHRRNRRRQQQPTVDKDVQCSMDSVSLISSCSSLANQAARTTIKVPYAGNGQQEPHYATIRAAEPMDKATELPPLKLERDIERLRRRLEDINTITIGEPQVSKRPEVDHFDYKPLIANLQPANQFAMVQPPKQQRIIEAYNVRVIQHQTPLFSGSNQNKPLGHSVKELSNSIAQLELLNNLAAAGNSQQQPALNMDNNNETNFSLERFIKHKAVPVITNDSSDSFGLLDDDRLSLMSSCSLRSSRTYDIRCMNSSNNNNSISMANLSQPEASSNLESDGIELNDERDFPVQQATGKTEDTGSQELAAGNNTKPNEKLAAWIYDIRDGSSTAIKAPPKPKKPEVPKVDAKELAQSRGGRSYYLELIEQAPQRPQVDSSRLYSRWSSQGALSLEQPAAGRASSRYESPQRQPSPVKPPLTSASSVARANETANRKCRQLAPASTINCPQQEEAGGQKPVVPKKVPTATNWTADGRLRRQFPFGASSSPIARMGTKSKSSSCLIGAPSVRQTKYSIYGGLRKPEGDSNKPVPRLSYSRAIGPKSQRQLDAQPKTPSRYLKMK